MTPQEIIETTEVRFPLLLYQGYAASEEPRKDDEGKKILWPRELRRALRAYETKAGVLGHMTAELRDVNPKTKTVKLPNDFLGLNMCVDSLGVYIKTEVSSDPDGEKILKLIPLKWSATRYPARISYFIRLTDHIENNRELPPECDCDLICDYLEALVGEVNSQYNDALESFDMKTGQKTRTEYQEQRKICEAEFRKLRKLPEIAATGF